MKAKKLGVILDGRIEANVRLAAEKIAGGEIVAFPTETVYGLGADAFNQAAVNKIFDAKGRPFTDPLIVHISDRRQLDLLVESVSSDAEKLISKFWPGPLTLVFKKKNSVSDLVTAGLSTVGVRMPSHPIALSLIRLVGKPVAAPSANHFQSMSPTTAEHVQKELGQEIDLILNGGPCRVGVESTVMMLDPEPIILRSGGATREAIESVLGKAIAVLGEENFVPNSGRVAEGRGGDALPQMAPGLTDFHYAPKKPLNFVNQWELGKLFNSYQDKTDLTVSHLGEAVLICFSNSEKAQWSLKGFGEVWCLSPTGDLEEAARELFSILRKADESRFKKIITLAVPAKGLGVAINERLQKAKHGQ